MSDSSRAVTACVITTRLCHNGHFSSTNSHSLPRSPHSPCTFTTPAPPMALPSHHERDENGKSKSVPRGDRNAAQRVWSAVSSLTHLPTFSSLILRRESPAAPSASPGTLELVPSWRCVTGGAGEGPGGE